jgi:cardiolipin synthase
MVFPYRPVHFARFRSFYANFRNHRKILVVDGETAYTGGINIGDEYLGNDPKIGFWRDTNIRLTGPSANHLQLVFAEDWYYVTKELLGPNYVNSVDNPETGGGIVQIVPSGPDRAREQIAQVYFTAITSAKSTLYITTPYFIPDEAVQTALVAAALRGVDVRLLVPRKSDTMTVTYASRSYYRELLSAGCRIYEYRKGFIHAKTMSVDGELGIVGTANMDIRSFKLNFEVCAVCYDKDVAEELDEHFLEDIRDSEQVRLSTFSKRPHVDKLLENTARLFSSML